MKCYFCQADHLPFVNYSQSVVECFQCAQKFNLHQIYTAYDRNGKLYITHIYVKKNVEIFHIRLWLTKNVTEISSSLSYDTIVTLDGFPINLQNAQQKLDTILTFL